MMLGIVSAIAYGILAMVGGLIGYAQARSQASLLSGLLSGVLLMLGDLSPDRVPTPQGDAV